MEKYERVVRLHRILSAARFPVSKVRLKDELDCSRATLYRTIAFLRDSLGAPIEQTDESGKVYYDRELPGVYELPGLWLSADELNALILAHQILEVRQSGVLGAAISPLRRRIEKLLGDGRAGGLGLMQRVRVVRLGSRQFDSAVFSALVSAIVACQCVEIEYHGRIKDKSSRRKISIQRLVYYRENWYVDAWCHRADALRSFAVDRIAQINTFNEAQVELSATELDSQLASAYGIFSGAARNQARLRFSSQRARWVADEHWHSQQQGEMLADGRYLLQVPYNEDTELLMDILRYGSDVEVLGPSSLRTAIKRRISAMRSIYA